MSVRTRCRQNDKQCWTWSDWNFRIWIYTVYPDQIVKHLSSFFRSIIEPVRNTGFRQTDHFHLSRATGIDFDKRIVNAESDLKPGLTYDLKYDKLVIGVGSLSNTFGVPGVIENACFLKVSCFVSSARFAQLLLLCWCYMALRHILGHLRRGQLTQPHCSWTSLLGSLPVLSAHSFPSNWQLPFLNQRKGENGHRNFFMTKSQRKNVLPDMRNEPLTIRIPGGWASNRATAARQIRKQWESQCNIFLQGKCYSYL